MHTDAVGVANVCVDVDAVDGQDLANGWAPRPRPVRGEGIVHTVAMIVAKERRIEQVKVVVVEQLANPSPSPSPNATTTTTSTMSPPPPMSHQAFECPVAWAARAAPKSEGTPSQSRQTCGPRSRRARQR
jgi:hypothetical protein